MVPSQRGTSPAGERLPSGHRAAQQRLRSLACAEQAAVLSRFFKTGPGEYGEGDRFIGVKVPVVRQVANEFPALTPAHTRALLRSRIHEERLLALIILVGQFTRGDDATRRQIYDLYCANTQHINNWDLVDLSAPQIVGGFLEQRNRRALDRLAKSPLLWERRISIVATHWFIRRADISDTLRIARRLLGDGEDLIHKATGWMLREVGKRDRAALESFLDEHAPGMPRTMLRYAIERLPEAQRRAYLRAGKSRTG